MKHTHLSIEWWLGIITSCVSLITFIYFYLHGHENLSYYDAIARLNTARKMIDSVTPGIGQLGGIWLPFPQVLMIPFIWNDFLWHSGIAGYLVSGPSFVLGAVFLYKGILELTNSKKTAVLIWFVFISNTNVLLLQSMAMSEVFYLSFAILTLYYLVLWIKHHQINHYLLLACCISILTLTRYEGYFIFLGVLLVVTIECFREYSYRQKDKIEGMLLLFITVAGFGIMLWCIYSALFYKNPLFWLFEYSPPPESFLQNYQTVTEQIYGIKNPNLFQSFVVYSSCMFWTCGVITVILGLLGMIMSVVRPTRALFSLLAVSVIFFACLVVGYYKGFIPHIEFPPVLLQGDKARAWSLYADNNVRYGIVFLPCMLFFAAWAASRNTFFYTLAVLIIAEQTLFGIINPNLFQYTFFVSWRYPQIAQVPWFVDHYDGGLILVAASRHEDFIFQTNLPYDNFIYEGTRKYWTTSLNDPSKYAKWVIYDNSITDDDVTTGLTLKGVNEIKKDYSLVYLYKGFHIYKLKKDLSAKSQVTTNSVTDNNLQQIAN